MADSMIFHRLSDNANDIGREMVRKAVKAILAETDADVITIKRADRDRIAMIECYVGGGEFYLVVTPDNKISMRLVTDIPGSSSSTYAITTIERGAKNGKKIRVAVRKIVTEDRVTRYLYSCLSVSETGTSVKSASRRSRARTTAPRRFMCLSKPWVKSALPTGFSSVSWITIVTTLTLRSPQMSFILVCGEMSLVLSLGLV